MISLLIEGIGRSRLQTSADNSKPDARISGNKKPRSMSGVSCIGCLAVSYSRMANATLPSALPRFTSEFGMG
ncbi:hypothetical protein ACET6X_09670, partial [Aeromonas veronii]